MTTSRQSHQVLSVQLKKVFKAVIIATLCAVPAAENARFITRCIVHIYTIFHLLASHGVLLLLKYKDVLQAEFGVCETIGPPHQIDTT